MRIARTPNRVAIAAPGGYNRGIPVCIRGGAMRTDLPAVSRWLDETAIRCAHNVGLYRRDEVASMREALSGAIRDFPQSALDAELLAGLRTGFARERRECMSPRAWSLWRTALQLQLRLTKRGRGAPDHESAKANWLEASREWFEVASGTSLNEPVRLVRHAGRPRDMVVSHVEVICDAQDIAGYAVLMATVFRPPRTSDCQLYFPGDSLCRLEWADLPEYAKQDVTTR
jgi:hypothetical protein